MAHLPSRLQKGTKHERLRRRGWKTQRWRQRLGGSPVHSCSGASTALGCSVYRTRHFHHSSWFSAPYTPGGILTCRYREGFWLKLEKEGFHRLVTQ